MNFFFFTPKGGPVLKLVQQTAKMWQCQRGSRATLQDKTSHKCENLRLFVYAAHRLRCYTASDSVTEGTATEITVVRREENV